MQMASSWEAEDSMVWFTADKNIEIFQLFKFKLSFFQMSHKQAFFLFKYLSRKRSNIEYYNIEY